MVLGLTAISTVALGAIAFVNSSAFDVDEISVVGAERADPELIIWATGIEVGQGLLDVSPERAAAEAELVPWVGTAEVNRRWSGSIEIVVTERGASAAIPAGDGFALVDDHGRQLEIVDARPPGYLPVTGIEASGLAGESAPPEAMPIIALLEALPPEVIDQVVGVAAGDGHLYLELADGGRADFGDGTDLAPKLQSLETLLARVDLRCLDTIDVSVPAAPVITRRPPQTSTADEPLEGSSQGGEAVSGDGEVPTSAEEAEEVPDQEPDSGLGDC